jgi:DNA-binding MltR family transcriptional regulator
MSSDELSIEALDDWDAFVGELNEESPRAAVIVGAAFVDDWLQLLLDHSMIADNHARRSLLGDGELADRPLSSFGSRVRAAYGLGLISKTEFEDLKIVSSIRNRFAHERQGFSFDDPKIASWCRSLKLPSLVLGSPSSPRSDRKVYELAIVLLATAIKARMVHAGRDRPSSPTDYDWKSVGRQASRWMQG